MLSATVLKQNLQKLAVKVYFCSVGPIPGSPGGRREVAQEGSPVLFVRSAGSGEKHLGESNRRSPPVGLGEARMGAAHRVGRAAVRANSVGTGNSHSLKSSLPMRSKQETNAFPLCARAAR